MSKKNRVYVGLLFLFIVLLIGPQILHMITGQPAQLNPSVEKKSESVTPALTPPHDLSPALAVKLDAELDVKLNADDQKRLDLLKEILKTKNDNDPRLDSELSHLSPALKKAMITAYTQMPAEKRNERGTVVFLIGRDANQKADIDFLQSVLMEKTLFKFE